MKRVTIQAPFTDGLVTDVPAHLLGPRMASQAENMIVLDGVACRRRGWSFTGNPAQADPILGVRTVNFALTGSTPRVVTTANGCFDEVGVTGQFYGDLLSPTINAATYLPRCVYNDELILCPRDGGRGIIRYAGAGWVGVSDTSWEFALRQIDSSAGGNPVTIALSASAGSARVTYTVPGVNPLSVQSLANLTDSQAGWFVLFAPVDAIPLLSLKMANVNATTTGTLASAISSGSAFSNTGSVVMPFGFAYAAVSVYSAGSVTTDAATDVVTGSGVQWQTGAWGAVAEYANPGYDNILLMPSGSNATHHSAISTGDTSISAIGVPTIATQTQYHITRGLPFKDACVHRNSLIGTGCPQYPNRVYICPPGWNLESPPGSQPPLSVATASFSNLDPNYFLVDFIDVPTSIDTDPCVAVMSSPGPLLVLKTDACHGIYGDFPNFTQSLIAEGAGCIDLRSTCDTRWGQFWCGPHGIYQFVNGRVVDITEGRINSTWRNLVNTYFGDAGFYCATGQSGDKLLISVGDALDGDTLCYDLATQRWDGFITNHKAVYFDAPQDETQTLVWAAGADMADPEKLRDSGPMLQGSGPVVDGALLTTAAAPVFTATTGTGMARNEGIDGLSKMVDLAVSAEVEGPSTGHSKLTPSAEIAGGIDDENENSTQALPAIEPTASVSAIQRTRGRINRKGRTFGVKVDTTSTPSGNAQNADYDVKVHQITASFRDSRERA